MAGRGCMGGAPPPPPVRLPPPPPCHGQGQSAHPAAPPCSTAHHGPPPPPPGPTHHPVHVHADEPPMQSSALHHTGSTSTSTTPHGHTGPAIANIKRLRHVDVIKKMGIKVTFEDDGHHPTSCRPTSDSVPFLPQQQPPPHLSPFTD
uniref:Uncharacterized protein n=1 Tax=Kalanchoe fedtschenkoi TaxID=63787 RepID=A0A7N1A020_KALFE